MDHTSTGKARQRGSRPGDFFMTYQYHKGEENQIPITIPNSFIPISSPPSQFSTISTFTFLLLIDLLLDLGYSVNVDPSIVVSSMSSSDPASGCFADSASQSSSSISAESSSAQALLSSLLLTVHDTRR